MNLTDQLMAEGRARPKVTPTPPGHMYNVRRHLSG